MKKTLLLILLSVFTLVNADAQGLTFGAKAGVNLSTFTGDSFTGFDTRVGLHIGGLAEIPLTEKFSVQPEVLYSQKGSKFFGSETLLSYIDVPILAKYHIIHGLSAELGPVPSFLVEAEYTTNGLENNVSEYIRTFDFGIGGGVSYQLPMGVFFSIRFTKGLMEIRESGKYDPNDDYKLNVDNNVFQVSTGYIF
ncbi:porin family protein [Aequorivita xiaoshiensis]|uniref:PorT family protein n=1 Tax=Aequorivita xiaoshiensis TaxID=2874476 RepID=A0A9X1R340_9FLAO|nr:porin family protein [Aequorivita xiaoshiensis]MCG2431396.1 PorT family protein [Aequorivita xiaoshiensis]